MFAHSTHRSSLFRAAVAAAAVCTATVAFAQMDDAPKPAVGHAMDRADAMAGDMKGGMQADMQVKQALMAIKQAGPDKAPDMMFVLENGMGNMFEAEFSKLVASKSQDAKVKELTMMVEKDHTEANQKLMKIADKLGVKLPTGLPSEKMQKLDTLGALPPELLEKAYLMDQRAIHAKDVTMFADHQPAVKDPELKAYIGEVLPKLKEHAMHINMVAKDKGAAAEGTPADAAGGKM